MKWFTEVPEEVIQNCLLTRERKDGSRYIELGAVIPNEHRNIIAYMPITHFLINKDGWKSEHVGDELPNNNGDYLCCTDNVHAIYNFWFDSKKCTFGGSNKIIAFMDVPKPYVGKKKLQLV